MVGPGVPLSPLVGSYTGRTPRGWEAEAIFRSKPVLPGSTVTLPSLMNSLFRTLAPAFLSTTLLAGACQRTATQAPPSTACIDPAKVNPDGICTMDYNPVCGCNGQTYANPCTARNAGVRTFTTGPCPTRP